MNIDKLKNNYIKLHYFGLGFVQLVVDEDIRYHFYNVSIKNKRTNEEIHNHRYNFQSKVLKGNLKENIYDVCQGNTHFIENESCGKDLDNIPNNVINCSVILLGNLQHKEGDNYFRAFNSFHTVDYHENTITRLKRSKIITDYAQIIRENGAEKTCPFSTKISEADLWDIIKDTIGD